MADPVTDPVAEHDARYAEEDAGPPEWAEARDTLGPPTTCQIALASSVKAGAPRGP
jgi:hypothetical protein